MPKKDITHGGKRNNSGRKPVAYEEKKKTVSFYPKQKIVDALGEENVKQIALKAVEKEYVKYNKVS